MHRLLAIAFALALGLPVSVSAAPEFAPNPRQAYEGFVGINPPRADVPVGALWIKHYGPTGPSAAPDNLETVRSLNGLTIDKNLQIALSFGILELLGVDPKLRDRYTARFSDLSIVRVKDVSTLAGPKGEPRIVEAIKAGSVTVSSDSELGLNGQTLGWRLDVAGSASSGRTRTYAIEARDMFIAIRVATPEVTRSNERQLQISSDGKSARIDDYVVVMARQHCQSGSRTCVPRFGIAKVNTQTVTEVDTSDLGAAGTAKLKLPIPTSDGRSGLFDHLVVRWVPACDQVQQEGCRREPRLFAHYQGSRLADLRSVEARGWR